MGLRNWIWSFSAYDFDFDEDLEECDWINVLSRTCRDASVFEMKVTDIIGNPEPNRECCTKELISGKNDIPMIKTDSSFSSLISRMSFSSSEAKKENNKNEEDPIGDAGFINFDTTALIALVSGIGNGGTEKLLAAPEAELRRRFKGNF